MNDRYEDRGPLGRGGMAEVRRVYDRLFDRTLAMKITHREIARQPDLMARFQAEAKATAQLQHPHIVPVHEMGELPDGRLWFTMREVQGRTLGEVIALVHREGSDPFVAGPSGWSLRSLVNAFHKACSAVAFAHEHGVVHRDLKPQNIMVGALGEVYVLDWGVAKVLRQAEAAHSTGDHHPADPQATRAGTIAGTPAYMAPEQARGDLHLLDARADVYALGAILYEILSGEPPFRGTAHEVLQQVRHGPPKDLLPSAPALTFGFDLEDTDDEPSGPVRSLPAELVSACERAMRRETHERFPSAAAFAQAITEWLDGTRRRAEALLVLDRATASVREVDTLLARAQHLENEANRMLEAVAHWEPEERKHASWSLADDARSARRAARLKDLEVDEAVQAALRLDPGLAEGRAFLIERQRARLAKAEAQRDLDDVALARALIAEHAAALPEGHSVRRRAAALLKGDGALTLVTDPPGAEVTLHRYVERHRRLVAVPMRSIGRAPIERLALPMGSYLCEIRHPGYEPTWYPVEIAREQHWDGVPPGAHAPQPVPLLPRGSLGRDEIYVPPGWFRAGGHPDEDGHELFRAWADGFVIDRFPVTQAQYITFLDDLAAQGRLDEACALAPRARGADPADRDAILYDVRDGRFALKTDEDGHQWLPDWPVMHVGWEAARACLRWRAARTGRPWRLPMELEWEKAARGVDGRWYPWGDHLDPSWCQMGNSHQGERLPAVVDSRPVDTSPYGVRGMAGNVQDFTLELTPTPRPLQPVERVQVREPEDLPRGLATGRGGTWFILWRGANACHRSHYDLSFRDSTVGFRGVRSIADRGAGPPRGPRPGP